MSVSPGSSQRNKRVVVTPDGVPISVERIGTDGDVAKARSFFSELDGKVDALGVGGVDLYLRLDGRAYPLHAALKLVQNVRQTPVVDGRGLKHTLERRVLELAGPQLSERLHFRHAFLPVAVDRLGLAEAVAEVSDHIVIGDFLIALGIPIAIRGIPQYRRVARVMFPLVSHFPKGLLFYGGSGTEDDPKHWRTFREADPIAGDFLFMRKYLPLDLGGKGVITNTTTGDNVELLRKRGVRLLITTTPRYEGRSFGTNMMEAALTAYAGKGRALADSELDRLVDRLGLRPSVYWLSDSP